ncbi:MAG: L,D-transpeptidase family protein [Gammaproteobacteria bacterium]|jgi:hypothetical protein
MNKRRITIDLHAQILHLFDGDELQRTYRVSTAANGPGELVDSECTPCGRHVIDEKFGDGCAPDTVFVGRRPTGETYAAELRERNPGRDWIVTRILWLAGREPGRNAGGNVDTKSRYIYIHGTPDDTDMSVPGSHGCVRMRNADIMELYDLVQPGTAVVITQGARGCDSTP